MFNKEFYPTPSNVIAMMLECFSFAGKTAFEPSAGKGDLVKAIQTAGGDVIACEIDDDLRAIVQRYCNVIGTDCLKVQPDEISHVHFIVMNPPFSNADKHILRMWEIAPEGCQIIAICNTETIDNKYSSTRKQLGTLIKDYGYSKDLDNCFTEAERKTGVSVTLVAIKKPSNDYNKEFQGFFMDEDPPEHQENAILIHNPVREMVQRYCAGIKQYDEMLGAHDKLKSIIGRFMPYGFYEDERHNSRVSMPSKEEFRRQLQAGAWKHVIGIFKMEKYATRGLMEDINKFFAEQSKIPFTMRNIYHMVDIIIQTHGQRMDKTLEEAFDKITYHYDENRYFVEGWKTNSHYLVGKKFILPWITEVSFRGEMSWRVSGNIDVVEDLCKALCNLTGQEYSNIPRLQDVIRGAEWGQWLDWGFFEVRGYKKGSAHFKFKEEQVWEAFNKQVARIKGYPLFESTKNNNTQAETGLQVINKQQTLF